MNREKLAEIMKERKRIDIETQGNWYDGIRMCRDQILKLVSEDVPGFLEYLKSDCNSEVFLYLSESLDDFVDHLKSQEIVDTFRELIRTKFQKEEQTYNISQDIREAVEIYGKGLVH